MEGFVTLLFFVAVSIICLVGVVSRSAGGSEYAYRFWRMNQQARNDADAVSRAVFLVFALLSSMLTIVIIVFGIVRWFTR